MKKICVVKQLGMIPYQEAWDRQNDLAERIAQGEHPETLLLLEHPHTYTLGRRGDADNLLWSKEQLQSKGVRVVWVDRGGDITYHGPGQLVGYPLLQLAQIGWQGDRLPQADYVGYIRKLERVLMDALVAFDILTYRVEGKTGVWTKTKGGEGLKKIASIGVKVDSRGISRHGFALNVDPDMTYWEGIVPCGLKDAVMTSMTDFLGKVLDIRNVLDILVGCFGEVFNKEMIKRALSSHLFDS